MKLPILLEMNGLKALVVGGGKVGFSVAETLSAGLRPSPRPGVRSPCSPGQTAAKRLSPDVP